MAVLDAKLPAWQASTKAVSPTKVEAKTLEGKCPLIVDGGGGLPPTTRLLLKEQPSKAQNGLFEVTKNECIGGEGKVGGSGKIGVGEGWTLVRPSDADSPGDVTEGMLVPVEDGATNQQTSWIQRTASPIEVGTTAQTFEALVAGARGTAGGELEGTYSKPSIKEAVIDNNNIAAGAAIDGSKLDLEASVAASDLATTAKELSPQLVETGKRKLNFGSIAVEWPGGSAQSSIMKVTHGLGVEPKAVSATESAFNVTAMCFCGEKTASTFSVIGQTVDGTIPAKGFKMQVDWFAIG